MLRPRVLMRKCPSLSGSGPGITLTGTIILTAIIIGRTIIDMGITDPITGPAGIGTTATIVTTITTDTKLA